MVGFAITRVAFLVAASVSARAWSPSGPVDATALAATPNVRRNARRPSLASCRMIILAILRFCCASRHSNLDGTTTRYEFLTFLKDLEPVAGAASLVTVR